jgi:hypothetical protein
MGAGKAIPKTYFLLSSATLATRDTRHWCMRRPMRRLINQRLCGICFRCRRSREFLVIIIWWFDGGLVKKSICYFVSTFLYAANGSFRKLWRLLLRAEVGAMFCLYVPAASFNTFNKLAAAPPICSWCCELGPFERLLNCLRCRSGSSSDSDSDFASSESLLVRDISSRSKFLVGGLDVSPFWTRAPLSSIDLAA